MENTTQELMYQIAMIFVSGLLTVITAEIKSYFKKKKEILGYEFDNARIERILDNAINYAERKIEPYVEKKAGELTDNKRIEFAKKYIDKIDPDIVRKNGRALNDMIVRKINQRVLDGNN